MAYIPRSSFGQTPGVIPMQVKKKYTIRVFSLLSTVILVCALVGTIGLFFYKSHLEKQLTSAQESLNNLSDSTSERKMHEIEVYDRKLNVAHRLLNNHIAATRLFDTLENSTKQTVRYKSLEYLYDPGFEAEVTLRGDTKELESVALQKMQFFKDTTFSDFVVRDIKSSSFNQSGVGDMPRMQNATADGSLEDLGVGFEVVGIFKKEALEYSGGPYMESTPVVPDTESSDPNSLQNQALDAVTPATSTSNETPTI